jgi:hypothetical protein
MVNNGWCPHQVDHLSYKYGLSTFSYLATLERLPARLADHQRCTLHEKCVAYDTDPVTYETRHTTTDCVCAMVSVPYESLVKITRKGHVPLISIHSSASTDGLLELRVHRRSRKDKYIAITHVWADGLGNPRENSLPTCQIKRLQQSMSALSDVSRKWRNSG